jgi:hypothetical protein
MNKAYRPKKRYQTTGESSNARRQKEKSKQLDDTSAAEHRDSRLESNKTTSIGYSKEIELL